MSAFPASMQSREADILSSLIPDKPATALDFITSTVEPDSILVLASSPVHDKKYSKNGELLLANHAKGKSAVSVLDFIAGSYSGHDFYSSGNWEPSVSLNRGLRTPPPRMSGSYMIPACWGRVSSGFGYRERFKRMHKGLDFSMPVGDTIRVILPGVVKRISYEGKGYGLYVVVEHNGGFETRYAHLSRSLISQGDRIEAGHPIALSGNTGNSTGPHLHFETRFHGVAVDPSAVFDFEDGRYAPYAPGGALLAAHKNFPGTGSANKTESTQKTQGDIYIVKAGDTLSIISEKTGVPIARICKINRIKRKDKLRVGRRIFLK